MCTGVQNRNFSKKEGFLLWEENEEACTHTFYTLHDKPYVFITTKGVTEGTMKYKSVFRQMYVYNLDELVECCYCVCCIDRNYIQRIKTRMENREEKTTPKV